ncbi:hypothetical protein LSAT2_008315, partial [Lamellibrachia satsuma]
SHASHPTVDIDRGHVGLDHSSDSAATVNGNWIFEQWDSGLWSGESSYQLFCVGKHEYVRRRMDEKYSAECICPTMKPVDGSLIEEKG